MKTLPLDCQCGNCGQPAERITSSHGNGATVGIYYCFECHKQTVLTDGPVYVVTTK